MAKHLIGMDIGNGELSIYHDGEMVVKTVPENMVNEQGVADSDKLGQFIKNVLKEAGIGSREVAVVLPEESTYFRTLELQPMTDAELKLNLPYEFRDYVGDDTDGYFYDYAMDDVEYAEDGSPVKMHLFAAAGLKSAIAQVEDILKVAGLKPVLAVPREMALVSLFRNAIDEGADPDKEYCIVDVGYSRTRVYIVTNARINGSKTIEIGAGRFYSNVNTTPEERTAMFDRLSVEIMKAINFYKYEFPDSEIEDIYFCGTESINKDLRTAIIQYLGLKEQSLTEILPSEAKSTQDAFRGIVAIGATM